MKRILLAVSLLFASAAFAQSHSVTLSCTPSTTADVTGYNFYRSLTASGGFAKVNSSPAGSCSYQDGSVAASTTYYYYATSVDPNGESGPSNQVSTTVPGNTQTCTPPATLVNGVCTQPPPTATPKALAVITDSTGKTLVSAVETFSDNSTQNLTSITTLTAQAAPPPTCNPPNTMVNGVCTPPGPTVGGPVAIVIGPMLSGKVGIPYSYQLPITGGTPPYKVIITQGTLPPGINVSSTGLVSGTPTTVFTSNMYFYITDSNGVRPVTADPKYGNVGGFLLQITN